MQNAKYIGAAEASERLNVPQATLARWAATGRVDGAHRGDSGRWQIPERWVRRVLDRHWKRILEGQPPNTRRGLT